MKKIVTFFIFLAMIILHQAVYAETTLSPAMQKKFQLLAQKAPNIDKKVLKLSLIAWSNAAKKGLNQRPILTVIDYSKPSYEKRLWVFDLQHDQSLYNTWVSHGKNSGNVHARSFSNRFQSLQSSLGLFMTAETYYGKNGYALRMRGLEPGYNDHAYQRAIVFHGARYVNSHHTGRSWGCPAVSREVARPLINTIKHHSLVFAYSPNRNWLSHSRYLQA